MKIFIRDIIVGSLAITAALAFVIWWNAPDYRVCAKSNGQTLCYVVIK